MPSALRLDAGQSIHLRKNATLFFTLALPVLIAIWFVPWFVSQDGPMHLYNAYVSNEVARGNSFLGEAYSVRGGLLPYLGGYKLLTWLTFLSARTADRLMMSITMLGLACSIVWLRWRVAGWDGMYFIVPIALLLALTRLWLLGLYPFLLGACVFPVALGIWWPWRNHMTFPKSVLLAAVLVLGYFFHVVGTGFTVLGLGILAVATPTTAAWPRRLIWTAVSVAPVTGLIVWFGVLMHRSGEGAKWSGLSNIASLTDWLRYMQAPDFVSFSFKTTIGGVLAIAEDCPFVREPSLQFAILAPSLWLLAGLGLAVFATLRGRANLAKLIKSERRGWLVLIVLLFAVGLFGPAEISEGTFFRERVLLLAVAAMVPALDLVPSTPARIAGACLVTAVALQSLFIWDYALISNRITGLIMESARYVGAGKRIGLLVADSRTQYLVTPIPNVVNQLGVEKNNIVWNNWSANYYYFPLTFRNDVARASAAEFLQLSGFFMSGEAEQLAMKNRETLARACDQAFRETDAVLVWGEANWFDQISERWYPAGPAYRHDSLSVFLGAHAVGGSARN